MYLAININSYLVVTGTISRTAVLVFEFVVKVISPFPFHGQETYLIKVA